MKKAILLAMAGFLVFGAAVMLSSRNNPDTGTTGLKRYYGLIVDRVIMECQLRSRLRGGRIQQASVINCLKSTYFKLRRDHLIAELLGKKIGKNEFLTRYHLNGSFYATIRNPAFNRLTAASH